MQNTRLERTERVGGRKICSNVAMHERDGYSLCCIRLCSCLTGTGSEEHETETVLLCELVHIQTLY